MTRSFARVIVVNQDGQMLVICQQHTHVSNYCFPGGKVEPAETPKAAAVRELYEELGIKVAKRHLRHCLTSKFYFGNEAWIGHFYVCAYGGKRPTIMELDKISSAAFYHLNDMVSLPCDEPSFIEVARNAENTISTTQAEIVNVRIFA
ncbi:NUDIX hydrolase [Methylobacterium sp. WL6]|uniref:NUDIX hydrolase n=1 Tax=Methylobacterium sp. WL6 TaxID=2603901 RepID=UPI0011CC3DE5|nr:NUDIX hydrolase [Methylobacterium sp. WL6]TXN72847.1 NUDIX hydrolase [Methylobacterium sp. WL6]